MGSSTRWLIFAPVALLALFAQPVKADILGDWEYSQSGNCNGSVEVINNTIILHGPDGGCGGANWVKIETTIPAGVNTVDFTWTYQTNDGAWYDPPQYAVNGTYIQLTTQNYATGTKSIPVSEGDVFTFRQYSTDTCCQPGHLTIDNLSLWEFTTTSTTPTTTTTTTVPTESVPVTELSTTTVQETTTSSSPTTTLLPVEPTMPEPSTTQTPTTTILETTTSTTTTTSTVVPTTTTTEPVSTPVAQPPVVVAPEPIEEPTTQDTEPTPTTEETVEETIQETIPLEPPSTEPEPEPEVTEETTVPPIETTTTEETIPVEEKFVEEQIEEYMEIEEEQAVAVAQNAGVLASLSVSEAIAVFDAIDVDNLSTEEAQAIVEAVQNAPAEVRKAFEDEINIFSPGFDNYVPLGSNIPVSTRRTLIAVAAGAAITAVGSRRR